MTDSSGCVPGASPGLDESWLVVNQGKDGALIEAVMASAANDTKREDRGGDGTGEGRVGDGNQNIHDSRDIGSRSEGEGGRGKEGEAGCDEPAALEWEVGQMVAVQKYGHGVVRWIGEVGGERMAGIELDEYREGCGDGCLPGSDKPLFSCDRGHGVFSPISDLTPDSRFLEQVDSGSPETGRPTQLFEQGSMVEVRGYGFGVVQWLGDVAGRQAVGVELEEYREQCGDGTPDGGEKVLFPCQPGHSVFTSLSDLKPDSRFQAVESVNPLCHLSLEPVSEKMAIPPPDHYSHGQPWGVQGEHNSCYIDATLFTLFALSSEFDDILTPQGGPQGEVATEICTILSTHIINPLRKNGVLRCEPIQRLRDQLDRLGKMAGLTQEEKDPEEFLNMLFKHALSIEPFISIERPQGEEGEFFVQLFLEPDSSLKLPSISNLLTKMFSEQSIKFSKVPNKLLIQVPRYGKQFKTFQRIIPDKILYINALCTSKGLLAECGSERTAHLHLLSVVCIETSHYVCFTWSGERWIFMDSMADRVDNCYNIPSCVDCTDQLEQWVYGDKQNSKLHKQSAKKLPDLVRRFTQDVYMCVYIEDSTAV